MFTIGIVVVLITGYAIWRYTKSQGAWRKYGPLMPPQTRLSWKGSQSFVPANRAPLAKSAAATGGGPFGSSEFTVAVGPVERGKDALGDFLKEPGTWAAAADGVIAGGFLAHAALNIDPHVLNAIEFSTADHLRGLADIDQYVHDHFFAVPVQSADGWFERLTGYVAEQKAAAYFETMGHHVVFAPVANQPVWDMLVDGHPVQIKEGLAGAKDFIVQHPGVEVYAPHDVAAAIKDPAVHGLAVLNKDAVHAATHNAIDNIHEAVSPEFHIPFITLGLSSWREAKLLWNEKTTFERAFTHVGLDVVGVGGGAWAGAKGGAFAGTFIGGPVGAAIGGFIGAILGGISGKMLSTTIRYAPFNSAKEEYNSAVSSAQWNVNAEIERSKRRVAELQTEYQQQYIEARCRIESTAKGEIAKVTEAFDRDLVRFCEQFPKFLRELLRQLDREEDEVLSRTPPTGFWGVLFPSDNDLYRGIIQAWFKRARKLVRVEIKAYQEIEPRTVENLHAEVQRFLKEYTFELKSMADELTCVAHHYESAQKDAEAIRDGAEKDTETTRAGLIQEFAKHATSLQETIVGEITRWNGIIASKRTVLKNEAAAIGVDL